MKNKKNQKGKGLNKLLDSNLFNQEFVPKRHKFSDHRAKVEILLVFAQRKTLQNGGKK